MSEKIPSQTSYHHIATANSAPIPPAIRAAAAWVWGDTLAAPFFGDTLTVCVDPVVLSVLVVLVFGVVVVLGLVCVVEFVALVLVEFVEVVVELRELVVGVESIDKMEPGKVRMALEVVPKPVVEVDTAVVEDPKG